MGCQESEWCSQSLNMQQDLFYIQAYAIFEML